RALLQPREKVSASAASAASAREFRRKIDRNLRYLDVPADARCPLCPAARTRHDRALVRRALHVERTLSPRDGGRPLRRAVLLSLGGGSVCEGGAGGVPCAARDVRR